MRGMMARAEARSRMRQDRNWVRFGNEPGIRRLRSDPASWPVVPVQPRWLSGRCGFDVRLPQLDDLSARLDGLQNAYDAFAQDMDQKGRKWTKDIRDNSQAVRENAKAVQHAEQGSVARDVKLSAAVNDVDRGSIVRDIGLSSKIGDVDRGSIVRDAGLSSAIDDARPIDYSMYFERIISAQHDYRPLLSAMIQTQERIISAQHGYKQQLDVIIANQ